MPKVIRCDPKLFEKDLTGKVIIVTGANSGIGLETTRQLCLQKATLILACRNESKAQTALDDIKSFCSPSDINAKFIPLDLSDLSSIKEFSTKFLQEYNRLDVLINNAGVMACPHSQTKDGFETQFGSNHLGHFLLFQLLSPTMVETATTKSKEPSRLISVSSCAASSMMMMSSELATVDLDDLNWEKRTYSSVVAYQQSKLSNYLFALEASKKFDPKELIAVSLHPGWVRSNLDQHVTPAGFVGNLIRNVFQMTGMMIGAVDGAQTTLHCVLSDVDDIENGAFYSQHGPYLDKASRKGGWPLKLPNKNATPELAEKLWDESAKILSGK